MSDEHTDPLGELVANKYRLLEAENERLRAALAGMVADHESEFPSHRCGFLAAAKDALAQVIPSPESDPA